MRFTAFFRNTNLGRPGSPSKTQLETSFADAGALEARSFQTNGTLMFGAGSAAEANTILRRATTSLRQTCGLREPGCIRSIAALRQIPFDEVFAGFDASQIFEFTVSFACGRPRNPVIVPCSNPRGDAEILWFSRGNALSLTRKIMSGPGSPNRLLEQLANVPFTSRSLTTVRRLLALDA